MVFFTEKPRRRAASCCSLEVMKGGTGWRFFSLASTLDTLNSVFSVSPTTLSDSSWLVIFALLPSISCSLA